MTENHAVENIKDIGGIHRPILDPHPDLVGTLGDGEVEVDRTTLTVPVKIVETTTGIF